MVWSKKEICLLLVYLLAGGDLRSKGWSAHAKLLDMFPNATTSLSNRLEDKLTIPSEFPTESPAPSPSPSEAPTNDPERITIAPSSFPTESPAPSPSPSQAPTMFPTGTPSSAPTAAPTISSAPSQTPTATPSNMPSDMPSMAPSAHPTSSAVPSDMPSVAPSALPSLAPSISPSDQPSGTPSTSPTYSPTQETQKTKTTLSNVFLLRIPREMDDITLARFEIATLEFIRQAQPQSKDYDLEILAVTVLTQAIVFPDHYEIEENGRTNEQHPSTHDSDRKLLDANFTTTTSWDVALEVSFRTVAVVTSGRVPNDFKLKEIVEYGFDNNYDQYLWQLGNSNEFFAPLKEISNWPTQQAMKIEEESKGGKKGTFVVALLFSILAIGVAIYASYYAVTKHMNRSRRYGRHTKGSSSTSPANSLNGHKKHNMEYSSPEVINYLTNSTNEDSTASYHDGDVEGGGAINLVKSMDSDDQSMESVGLTPRAARGSPSLRRVGYFTVSEETSPLKSPVTVRSSKNDASTYSFGLRSASPGKIIKKWMTPRKSTDRFSNNGGAKNRFSSGSNVDPPQKERPSDRLTSKRKSMEPDAKKAGILSRNNAEVQEAIEVIKNRSGEDGDFTLPVSYFSTGHDSGSDMRSPLSSLAPSNASSSFFSNMGKSFAGNESENVTPSLNAIPSNPTIKENYAFSEVSERRSEAPSTIVNSQGVFKPAQPVNKYPKITKTESDVSDGSSSRVQQVVAEINRRQQEQQQKTKLPPPAHPKKVFKSQSIEEGFETILGARSRSMEEDEVVQNMPPKPSHPKTAKFPVQVTNSIMKAPSATPTSRSTYGYPQENNGMNKVTTTLGARQKGELTENNDEDDRSTFSTVVKRSGTYDVYAPSGPIGIVVDTSKKGPSVHSLKSTSPMLGLITAGDLIIALDDEDTRGLSAAELTRLMAKKSRQRERKITLYSVDGY